MTIPEIITYGAVLLTLALIAGAVLG